MSPETSPSDIQYVCVSHRHDIFQRHVGDNPHVPAEQVIRYDNSVENIAIPLRYNHFVENTMGDGWVVFMHHDMQFDEPLAPRLAALPQDAIYGVCGIQLMLGQRYVHIRRKSRWTLTIEHGRHYVADCLGQIRCKPSFLPGGLVGRYCTNLPIVETVDCCCIIIHSSLIKRHGLRFAPEFTWHFYSEELSLRARRQHGITTRVVQLECGHFGSANIDDEFFKLAERLVATYGAYGFASTCYEPPHSGGMARFNGRRGLLINY